MKFFAALSVFAAATLVSAGPLLVERDFVPGAPLPDVPTFPKNYRPGAGATPPAGLVIVPTVVPKEPQHFFRSKPGRSRPAATPTPVASSAPAASA